VIGPIVKAIGKLYAVEEQETQIVERIVLEGQEALAVYTKLRTEHSKSHLAIIHELLLPDIRK
jgi:hypothetical protein